MRPQRDSTGSDRTNNLRGEFILRRPQLMELGLRGELSLHEYLPCGSGQDGQGSRPGVCLDDEGIFPSEQPMVIGATVSRTPTMSVDKRNRLPAVSSISAPPRQNRSLVDEGDRVRGAGQEEGRQRQSSSTIIFDDQDGINRSSHALDERLVVPAGTLLGRERRS